MAHTGAWLHARTPGESARAGAQQAPGAPAQRACNRARTADDEPAEWAPAEWARMLSAMDAVLLPYDPTVYLHKTSGILGECLWRLRPDARLLLTPGGWLEREARHWNLGFATCPYGDVDALLSCMHRWDSLLPLGTPAATAPALWARHFGVGNDEWMVEKLMGGA